MFSAGKFSSNTDLVNSLQAMRSAVQTYNHLYGSFSSIESFIAIFSCLSMSAAARLPLQAAFMMALTSHAGKGPPQN